MIGQFENITPLLSLVPECSAVNNINYINNAFFWKRGFSFDTLVKFGTFNDWIQAIKDMNIIPVLRVKMYEDQSKQTDFYDTVGNYQVELDQGKYIFKLTLLSTLDYHKQLILLSGGDYEFSFSDKNGNLIAYSPDKVQVLGFEVDMINFEKIPIGNESKASIDVLNIELAKPKQLDKYSYVIQPEWRVKDLNITKVTISEIEEGSLFFNVKDYVYGININGLNAYEININDASGAITFSSFRSLGNGDYVLDGLSSALTLGSIDVDSRLYYGSNDYILVQTAVTVSEVIYNSDDNFDFTLTIDANGDPATGLIVSGVTITDDVNGVLTGSLSELSAGKYRMAGLSNSLTTGDLDINTAEYLGTYAYSLAIQYTVYNITSLASDRISLSVRDQFYEPVTDRVLADFEATYTEVDPDPPVSMSIDSIVNNGSGNYTVIFNNPRTSGYVTATAQESSSTFTPFDFTNKGTVLNGGGADTTDFNDSDGDGLADFYTLFNAAFTSKSIVAGKTGSAQGLTYTSDSVKGTLRSSCYYFKPNQAYKLRVIAQLLKGLNVKVTSSDAAVSIDDNFTPSIDWNTFDTGTFTPSITTTTLDIEIVITGGFTTAELKIDYIELIEV